MLATTNAVRYRFTLLSDLLGTRRLRYEPIGWDAMATTVRRDAARHGAAVDFTSDLNFVKDGRAYLVRAYQAAGVKADVQVLIELYDPNAFTWLTYYRGRVNFLAAEIGPTQMKVNLESTGWLQKFLSRESVDVDLFAGTSVGGSSGPLAAQQRVQLHSRTILQRYAASQQGTTDLSPGSMYGPDADPSHEQLLYFGFNTAELNELGLGATGGGFVIGKVESAAPIHRMVGDGTLTLDCQLNYHVHIERQTGFLYRKFRKVDVKYHLRVEGSVNETINLLPPVENRVDSLYDAVVRIGRTQRTWQLKKDDAVYLYADYFVHELDGTNLDQYQVTCTAEMLPGSYLRLNATTTTAPTTTTGLLLYEAFDRLVQALTDERDVFRSDFFGRTDSSVPYAADGEGALTLVTGGFQVRGFPLLSSPAPVGGATDLRKTLTTNWNEFFSSCAAVWGLGWGLEWTTSRNGQPVQVIRVEPLGYWYSREVVLDLTDRGPVADTLKVDESRHYQLVEMGYDKWQAEQANGLDEFNAKHQYTTPLDVTSNSYVQVSKLATSGILLETARRNRFNATATTDTGQDETTFLVCLLRQGGGYVTERDQRALLVDGVLDPASVYNLRLSPARMLRRHGAVLQASLQYLPTSLVRFTSGEGNVTMRSQLMGEADLVVENADVTVRDLGQSLWAPEQITFTAPVTRKDLPAVLAGTNGRVRYRGADQKIHLGWLLEYKDDPYTRQAAFTLLPCLP